jgi:aspartyl protease
MPTVTYSTHFPWNRTATTAPQDNRPYAEVVLVGPHASPRIWCLVDSGADLIQLNRSFANTAGLNLATAASKTVHTAAGTTTTVDELQNVQFDVEGKTLTDTCLFGGNSVAILGRVTFLNAFELGFDLQGWMRT